MVSNRNFLEQLRWELAVEEYELANPGQKHPELAEVMERLGNETGYVLPSSFVDRSPGMDDEEYEQAVANFRADLLSRRRRQLEALQVVQDLITEAENSEAERHVEARDYI